LLLPEVAKDAFQGLPQGGVGPGTVDSEKGLDDGDLKDFHELCRRGVRKNWSALRQVKFLQKYHRCVAAIAKRVATLEKNWPWQVALFRRHNATRIVAEQRAIRDEWSRDKCFLNSRMVDAVIATAELPFQGSSGKKRCRYAPRRGLIP
jgi:hypothetical protein